MKKINFMLMYVIQLIMCIVAFVPFVVAFNSMDEEMIIPTWGYWMTIAGYIVFLVCLIVEYSVGKKPIIRTIILTIILTLSLVLLVSGVGYLIGALSLLSIVYLFVVMFTMFNYKGLDSTKSAGNKTLPEGACSKKENIITLFIMGGYVLALVGIILFCIFDIKPFISVPILCACVVILGFGLYKNNNIVRISKLANKELNYEKLELEINELLKNNLHPETRNYLLLMLINYQETYDLSKAIASFDTVSEPTNKNYKRVYNAVKAEIYLKANEIDKFHDAVGLVQDNIKAGLLILEKVLTTTDEILDIETIYPNNRKLPFLNAKAYYYKMIYYNTRNNTSKAVEYANIIKRYAPNLLEYVRYADMVLDSNK